MTNEQDRALGHLRVLDLTDLSGQYFGRLLGDLGADVVMVEPPGGTATRGMSPFANDIQDAERSLYHLTANANKRSVVLDLESAEGRAELERLVPSADIVIESYLPGHMEALGLGYDRLSTINPGVILTSITSFGQTGPYAGYRGSELVAQALGGLLYGWGDPDVRPGMMPLDQAFQLAAQHAAFATLAAVRYRRKTRRGQHVDVSAQEALAHILMTYSTYAARTDIQRRVGASTPFAPTNLYPNKDGYTLLMPGVPRHWAALVEWMDDPIFREEMWESLDFRRENYDLLDPAISELSMRYTKDDFTKEAQDRHIPAGPLTTIEDLAKHAHLQERGFFIDVDHPVVGKYKTVGATADWSETPWRIHRPAPLLGEHQQEVFDKWASNVPTPLESERPTLTPPSGALPLEGLRVLDFGRVWAGPFLTRYLAELGADVIKIETSLLPDREQATASPSMSFNFAEINRSKRSVTLNTTSPEGVRLFKELVRNADVVVENFRAGVMDGWGLSYDALKEVNPGVILVSMPGYGTTGPYSPYLSYGQTLLAFTGLMYLWGHPESEERTRPKGAFPDFIVAAHGAYAILSALEHLDKTGKGQRIEMAQVESLTSTMGEAFMDYFINGRVRKPQGNFNPNSAPHDLFPCLGEDAWCAIVCDTDDHWKALCGVAGEDQPWTQDERYATLAGRLEHLADLNAAIGGWTQEFTPRQVMRLLQQADVPAGIVSTAEDLYYDPQLRDRGFLVNIDHGPVFGVLDQPGVTVHLSETPSHPTGRLPDLGEHNQAVFGDMLGLSAEEIKRLQDEKVLY